MTTSKAPDFNGTYPGAGERIGPAWQRIWDALGDGRELTITELAALPDLGVVRATVSTLLYEAKKAGLLINRIEPHPTSNRLTIGYWRRSDSATADGRAERTEAAPTRGGRSWSEK